MTALWHLWRFCIGSAEQIITKSDSGISYLFFFQLYDICDVSTSSWVIRFYISLNYIYHCEHIYHLISIPNWQMAPRIFIIFFNLFIRYVKKIIIYFQMHFFQKFWRHSIISRFYQQNYFTSERFNALSGAIFMWSYVNSKTSNSFNIVCILNWILKTSLIKQWFVINTFIIYTDVCYLTFISSTHSSVLHKNDLYPTFVMYLDAYMYF